MTKILPWLGLGGILIFALGGWWLSNTHFAQKEKTRAIPTLTVDIGNLEDKISGERGIVELEDQRNLKSPVEGTVEQVLIKNGSKVKINQYLVRLKDTQKDNKILEHQHTLQSQLIVLAQKTQQFNQAKKNFEEIKNNFQRQWQRSQNLDQLDLEKKQREIDKQRFNVREQQRKLEQVNRELQEAQEKLQADEELLARGYIPEDQVQAQIINVRNAQSNLWNVASQLEQAERELEQLQLDLGIVQTNIAQKLTDNQENIRQAQKQVSEAENTLKQTELDLQLAQLELDKLKIEGTKIIQESTNNLVISPMNGQILDILVKTGDVVKLGDDLLTLGNPNQEIVKLQLSLLNAHKVKPSQLAYISIVGPNAQTFTGKVDTVSLLAKAEKTGNNQQVKVAATIAIDKPTGIIIPGTPVNVDIILEQKKAVIIVPLEAIKQENDLFFVWIKNKENKAEKRFVTLGLESLNEVEITSGLQAREEILLPSPEQTMEEGIIMEN